jgi:hypothetical protein
MYKIKKKSLFVFKSNFEMKIAHSKHHTHTLNIQFGGDVTGHLTWGVGGKSV